MIEKLRESFSEQVVYKDLSKDSFFMALGLPSFLRDWLLRHFEDDDGQFDPDEIREFVSQNIPRRDDWEAVKARIVVDGERVKILAQVLINVDVKKGTLYFTLPDFRLSDKETVIEPGDWEQFKDQVKVGVPVWGKLLLAYRYPTSAKVPGAIKLVGFEAFCPYEVDPDYFKEARRDFTVSEWMDVVLGAMDYNADGYQSETQKLTMLSRLLPFIEKRVNLIELAPKGTGKSYLFGRVSRYGWLSSGGTMTRAKMFYDIGKRTDGLVAGNDYVALDEVQTISFANVDEMRSALKGYMESGLYTVGNHQGSGDAGIILLGNIAKERMNEDEDMFVELPHEFHESALLDRFHGFIEGWNIPRMSNDLKVSGWAMNSEYFTTMMHLLRGDASYRAIVDELIVVPPKSDTRDTEAVKRIATAWLKLLFPHVQSADDVDIAEFERYCLAPALRMRGIVLRQIGILDPAEFGGKRMPELTAGGPNAY